MWQANRSDAIAGKPAHTRIVSHANLMLAGIIVGAGLPAMQAARSGRQTALLPSQASQPPQVLRRPLNPDLTGYDRQQIQSSNSRALNRRPIISSG